MSRTKPHIGKNLSYKWKHIIIDPPLGHPILFDGKVVGGILGRMEMWRGSVRVILLDGIEIIPEYRRKGIGTSLVKWIQGECDLILGSITEDECKPFWKTVGAEFRPLPLDCFAEHMLPTIHTKEPVFFFMTDHSLGREYAETFAKEVPDLMRKFPNGPPTYV